MTLFTNVQLRKIGFEPGMVFLHLSEASPEQLAEALDGTFVFGPAEPAQKVILKVSIDYLEPFARIEASGYSEVTLVDLTPGQAKAPRAAWIKGHIVGASAASVGEPAAILPSVAVTALVNFDPPPETTAPACWVWLQIVHSNPTESQRIPQIGTAQDLLTVITGR